MNDLKAEKCDHCGGSGEIAYSDSSGPISSAIYVCRKCRGLGRIYPAETLERLIAETGSWDRAVAVLDALNSQSTGETP